MHCCTFKVQRRWTAASLHTSSPKTSQLAVVSARMMHSNAKHASVTARCRAVTAWTAPCREPMSHQYWARANSCNDSPSSLPSSALPHLPSSVQMLALSCSVQHHAARLRIFLVVKQHRPGSDRHHVMHRCIQAAASQL